MVTSRKLGRFIQALEQSCLKSMASNPATPQRTQAGSCSMSESGEEQANHIGITTPPVESPIPISRLITRSCHACNRKKIRCNKKQPCSACTRAGRSCEYPASGPRIRRPKKTIIADMSSRIAELEKSLAKAKDSGPTTPSPHWTESVASSGQLKNALYSGPSEDSSRGDIVVQKGSSSQYFNEILLSRVIDEVLRPSGKVNTRTHLF